jgi:hypothetical protein
MSLASAEIGETDVDVELEQVDSRRSARHADHHTERSDGMV